MTIQVNICDSPNYTCLLLQIPLSEFVVIDNMHLVWH